MIKACIEKKLLDSFSPVSLNVEDVSHLHQGHAGHTGEGKSHFKVRIVSSVFQSMQRIQRHQQVYECLAEELRGGVHALQVTALSPEEASPAIG